MKDVASREYVIARAGGLVECKRTLPRCGIMRVDKFCFSCSYYTGFEASKQAEKRKNLYPSTNSLIRSNKVMNLEFF